MKICTRCNAEKPLSDFGVDRQKSSGRSARCKDCKRILSALSRANYANHDFRLEVKKCPDCEQVLSKDQFQTSRGSKTGLQAYCRKCGTARRRASRHGISRIEYIKITSQNCEACGTSENIVIDHDHNCCNSGSACGKCIRGALCKNCNFAEGLLKTQKNVEGLLRYMKEKGIQ